jgi:hypothetical protein
LHKYPGKIAILAIIGRFWKLTSMRFTELLLATEQVPAPVKVKSRQRPGRRRPGRDDQVSPHLISLLRSPATLDIPASLPGKLDPVFFEDDFALVRVIGFGLVLSLPLWAIIGAVIWAILG